MTGVDKEVDTQRTVIRSMVKQSVDSAVAGSLSPKKSPHRLLTKGPVLSPIKKTPRSSKSPKEEEKEAIPSPPVKVRPIVRRTSSVDSVDMTHLVDAQSEATTMDDRDDEAYDDDLGITRWVNKEFVYSFEVEEAIKKMRDRRDRKRQFNQTDVHIFNLPQIIKTGTPRIPFTPSIHKDISNFQLPEAVSLERTKKAKKKRKQYTEDDVGVYLNTWQSQNLGVNPDIIPTKTRLFRTQDDDND